jgi:peroxiredoxin
VLLAGLLIIASCEKDPSGPEDTESPAAITNLAIEEMAGTNVTLTWTAPGDDGNDGTAAVYDLRHSDRMLTESNWASASEVIGEPTPEQARTTQQMVVGGLQPDTHYYFALKTRDEAGNWSGISTVADTTTADSEQPPPPEFIGETCSGEVIRLSDYMGSPIILNFWASWCRPCRQEMAFLTQLYEDYRDRGLVIIGISLDVNHQTACRFPEEQGVEYPIVPDPGGIAQVYNVSSIPTNLYINKEGLIVERRVGYRGGGDDPVIIEIVERLLEEK